MKHTIEVPVYIHDTAWKSYYEIDTMYTDRWHYIDRKGDTVWMIDSVIVYRARYIHDTVKEYSEVPVTVTNTETVEVKKPLKWWEKGLMWSGVAGLLSVLGAVVWKTRKIWLRLIAI